MGKQNANGRRNTIRFVVFVVATLAVNAFVSREPLEAPSRPVSAVATYSNCVLQLTIPYHSTRNGSGKLTMEVLDPEDRVLRRAAQNLAARRWRGR